MPPNDDAEPTPPLSREELIALVTRAHLGSATADSQAAGKALASQSRLPKRVAENLGGGFGQWDYFPEIPDIVDFALTYVPPETEADLWALARTWAADDAASRHTLLRLIGRDLLSLELQRIAVPALRELIDEHRPARARELRLALGLDVRPAAAAPPAAARTKRALPAPVTSAPASDAPSASKTKHTAAPMRAMPKPERRAPAPPKPQEEARRFRHPKFGEGVLQAQEGAGADAKLTILFEGGPKTVLARYVTELPST